ncbi:MAG: hypothetical protein ACI4EA_04755, partial [Candidatus Ornithomonoglobus sp.]
MVNSLKRIIAVLSAVTVVAMAIPVSFAENEDEIENIDISIAADEVTVYSNDFTGLSGSYALGTVTTNVDIDENLTLYVGARATGGTTSTGWSFEQKDADHGISLLAKAGRYCNANRGPVLAFNVPSSELS